MKIGSLNTIYQAIFWLWNLTFLYVVYGLILPWSGIPLIQATITGEIESEFTIAFFSLIGVPTISTILGLVRFRQQPLKLIRLFYGVEAP